MNFISWALGLFFVYLLMNGTLATFLSMASQAGVQYGTNTGTSATNPNNVQQAPGILSAPIG